MIQGIAEGANLAPSRFALNRGSNHDAKDIKPNKS